MFSRKHVLIMTVFSIVILLSLSPVLAENLDNSSDVKSTTDNKVSQVSPTVIKNNISTTNNKMKVSTNISSANSGKVNGGYVIYKINQITLKDNNTNIKSPVKNGVSYFEYVIPSTWNKNNLSLQSVYSGSKSYKQARSSNDKIPFIYTRVHLNPMTKSTMSNITIPVTVSKNNVKVDEGNVTLYVDNKQIKTSRLSNGQTNFTIGHLNNGTHNITVKYTTAKYQDSINSTYIKVLSNTKILVKLNNSLNYKDPVKLQLNITDYYNKNVKDGYVTVYVDGTYHKKVSLKNSSNMVLYNISGGSHNIKLDYNTSSYCNTTKTVNVYLKPLTAHVRFNSSQVVENTSIYLPIYVDDELYNPVDGGKIALYINNKLLGTTRIINGSRILYIAKQKQGAYNLTAKYISSNYTVNDTHTILTVNPKSQYTIKSIYSQQIEKTLVKILRGHVRNNNNNNQTVNSGRVYFYLDGKLIGSNSTKNNLSTIRHNFTTTGNHHLKIAYYNNNNQFIIADNQIIQVIDKIPQKAQDTFISWSSDLINNTLTPSGKKDVYFAMDRTTSSSSNYSPNDMKIMNNIAYNLKINGFNVKTIRNGPGETYNTARYMYNNKVRNSICFILCNGVDANVIREYLKGNDNLLTAVRNRGNDIVMGWFYGAGNINDKDGEYYYYLPKAWDDNYSGKGGMYNPKSVMQKDGIKVIFEQNDFTGTTTANSFIKLYGGKVSEEIKASSVIKLKTTISNINNSTVSNGNLVYTINDKIIKNITVNKAPNTISYNVGQTRGTYLIKATYYKNNKIVCQTEDRYIKII